MAESGETVPLGPCCVAAQQQLYGKTSIKGPPDVNEAGLASRVHKPISQQPQLPIFIKWVDIPLKLIANTSHGGISCVAFIIHHFRSVLVCGPCKNLGSTKIFGAF